MATTPTTPADVRLDGPWPPRAMDDWVPHRGAMSLLGGVVRIEDQAVVAHVVVPAGGLFATPDGVPAWVGIEYMAQAIAAWSGARARANGGSPRIGFLLGSRRYEATVPVFAPGALLRVSAQCELIADNGLGMFECRITHDDRLLATGRLSVFEPGPDDTAQQGSRPPGATGEGQQR